MIGDDHYYEQQQETNPQWEAYEKHLEQQEAEYRATLTAQQLLDYMVHCGELEHCPNCGTRYADVDHGDHPDMVGTTYWTEYQCCGYTETANDAIEYNIRGEMVDIR